MGAETDLLLDIVFRATIVEWRGPAPFYFAAVPPDRVGEVSYAARLASYGWGVVPVEAAIGAVEFRTSLFPRDGGYLLPLKQAVRTQARIAVGDRVEVHLRVKYRS